MLNARDLDEVERLIDARTSTLYARLNALQAVQLAEGNSAQAVSTGLTNTGATGNFIYAACMLTARFTGKFALGWKVPINGAITADLLIPVCKSIAWTTAAWAPIAATGKQVLDHGPGGSITAMGTTGSQVGGAINGGSAPGWYNTGFSAVSLVDTVTGAGSTQTTHTTEQIPTLTGLLTANGMQFYAGSILVNPAGTTALGSPVCFQMVITSASFAQINFTGVSAFWAYEYPTL